MIRLLCLVFILVFNSNYAFAEKVIILPEKINLCQNGQPQKYLEIYSYNLTKVELIDRSPFYRLMIVWNIQDCGDYGPLNGSVSKYLNKAKLFKNVYDTLIGFDLLQKNNEKIIDNKFILSEFEFPAYELEESKYFQLRLISIKYPFYAKFKVLFN